LEDIRARLHPDELLIEFVAYSDRGARPRYGAFVLGRGGELQWTDLGTSAPMDQSIQDLIAAANDWSVSLTLNERRAAASAEQTAQEALRILSEKLKPLIASLTSRKDVQRLRVASDGMLNLLPLGALSDGHGHFLIERFAISYISASRDLAGPPVSGNPVGPLIIALSPGGGGRVTGTFRADRLERLEGAEIEARSIQKWIPKALLLGEGQATEQRIKQLHRPTLLHIVGHGIVRGNEDCRAAPASPACQLAGIDPAARVMSLSAIVLEEAYGRGGDSQQDGLLTALELQTLDLQGSEMLVLSQCRMADGVPSSGEGVFGMRRAAAIAGVKTFVAPLWKIADSTQQVLMDRFYKELSAGKGRAEALRQAQLQLLRNSRTASVLQWAPVILSGDSGPLPKELFVQ
jgi:CHAT domain-containing protein